MLSMALNYEVIGTSKWMNSADVTQESLNRLPGTASHQKQSVRAGDSSAQLFVCSPFCLSCAVYSREKPDICQHFVYPKRGQTGNYRVKEAAFDRPTQGKHSFAESMPNMWFPHPWSKLVQRALSAWNTFLVKTLDLIASFGVTLLCLLQPGISLLIWPYLLQAVCPVNDHKHHVHDLFFSCVLSWNV